MRLLAPICLAGCAAAARPAPTVVLVAASAEWRVLHELLTEPDEPSPSGLWFAHQLAGRPMIFLHAGVGKVASAASTQYAIDRWHPRLIVNLGTCGGFAGKTQVGDVILASKTVIYDVNEAMGDADEMIARYATTIDTSVWPAALRGEVRTEVLVSADRDLVPREIAALAERHHASAGDWESGAIAWIAARNRTPVLILRGVSDVVGPEGDAAYGDLSAFEKGTRIVMPKLLRLLERATPALTPR